MAQQLNSALSQMIFTTLDAMGYCRERILHRSEFIKEMREPSIRMFDYLNLPFHIEIVGSSGEGVPLSGSDIDTMFISKDTVCVDKARACRGFNIIEADYSNAAPGYIKISLSSAEGGRVYSFLLERSDLYCENQFSQVYISSPIFRNYFLQISQLANPLISQYVGSVVTKTTTNGPAVSMEFRILNQDVVPAIYFYGNSYLRKWSKRKRQFNWPSDSLIKEISQMEGYIVPVGSKFSDIQNIEWRVCYTTAEMELVKSLNDVHLKLYVLMKCVAKEIKRTVGSKDISSYVVKNVVFWIAETEPEQTLVPKHLVRLFKKAFMFIKYCLENNHLPNYMIAERSLISEKMSRNDKRKIIEHLTEYFANERFAIEKNPKLYNSMTFMYHTCDSQQRDFYKKWRNDVEDCFTALALCKLECHERELLLKETLAIDSESLFYKDERFFPIMIRFLDLVVPEWISLSLSRQNEYMVKLISARLQSMPGL